jgi:subtilisin family serine protease
MKAYILKLFVLSLLGVTLITCTESPITDVLVDEEISLLSRSQGSSKMVPNEMLVKFKKGTSTSKRNEVLAKLGGKVKENIITAAMKSQGDNEGIQLVSIPANALDAIARAKGFGEVQYAEPNYIYNHFATSNDSYFTNGSLWGMSANNNLNGCRANAAWAANKTGSSSVYIGVIDEGYMFSHEDLAANAGVNPGEIAGNGVDDDSNGYVDDVQGWDFANNDRTVFDGTVDDHGTHCAGTIGAVGGNGKGVAGVVWNVKMLSGKFLGSNGGTTANAIKAVDYFTNLKTRSVNPVNIVATSNSWGGGGFSQGLKDAIDRAGTAGILFVAAAGNSGTNNDVTVSYPSGYTSANIIAVASITSTGALSSFSQYGATTVDIGAPGSAVWSTVPVASGKGRKITIASGYASYSGTSMATPHVSGAVALYASLNPGATAAQIKSAILGSATPTASLAGKCVSGGRLNVSGF